MARHAAAAERPNHATWKPKHCACMPCRFGFPAGHLRRADLGSVMVVSEPAPKRVDAWLAS